ncbi:hypothetical protein GCM10009764_67640 [Nocardia ninae]|uniref:Uncharacterized protein n=1 Tax=Nocardia ninae NBRC 108245 TaxID=1210091 RepID=A0A511MS76_9NOCA|nr:hypothetical protein NN4_79740 [Nocardia ninae NBRC 108245]
MTGDQQRRAGCRAATAGDVSADGFVGDCSVVVIEQVFPDFADGDGGRGGEEGVDVRDEPVQGGSFAGAAKYRPGEFFCPYMRETAAPAAPPRIEYSSAQSTNPAVQRRQLTQSLSTAT